MSVVKIIEIQCDLCRVRHQCASELVANRNGITKGGLTKEVRAEAKSRGWIRKKIQSAITKHAWIDVCDKCRSRDIPAHVWFQEKNERR